MPFTCAYYMSMEYYTMKYVSLRHERRSGTFLSPRLLKKKKKKKQPTRGKNIAQRRAQSTYISIFFFFFNILQMTFICQLT